MTPSDYLGGGGWKVDIRSQLNRCEGGEDGNGGWKGDGRGLVGGCTARRFSIIPVGPSLYPFVTTLFRMVWWMRSGIFGVDGWFGGFSYSLQWWRKSSSIDAKTFKGSAGGIGARLGRENSPDVGTEKGLAAFFFLVRGIFVSVG